MKRFSRRPALAVLGALAVMAFVSLGAGAAGA